MGWVDKEPYFSMITNRQYELMDEGVLASAAWNIAYEECLDTLRDAGDAERKSLKGE